MVAILALLAVLAARAAAGPLDDRDGADPDAVDAGDLEPETAAVAGIEGGPELDARVGLASHGPHRPAPVPVSQVVEAALRAAGLARDPTTAWRHRARLAALVPTISVHDGRDSSWRDIANPTLGYVQVFSVSATWHLDHLVFEASELRIAALDVARRRERRRLAWFATQLYFTWLRTGSDEIAAQLDGLTDGWFSHAIGQPP